MRKTKLTEFEDKLSLEYDFGKQARTHWNCSPIPTWAARGLFVFVTALALCSGTSRAQQPAPSESFMKQAVIVHHGGTATVTANAEDPLAQALLAISREYGWLVDYQGLGAHPGTFQCDYDEAPTIKTPEGEKAVLQTVVSEYNRQHPGMYRQVFGNLKEKPTPRFEVEAISPPPLVTSIVFPKEKRNAQKTLELIVEGFSRPTYTLVLGEFPKEILASVDVTVGGLSTPTEGLLIDTLRQTGRPMVYQMVPNSNGQGWVLNIYLVNH